MNIGTAAKSYTYLIHDDHVICNPQDTDVRYETIDADTGSSNVLVGGNRTLRVTDPSDSHIYQLSPGSGLDPDYCPVSNTASDAITHVTYINEGSPNVYINNLSVAREYDQYTCSSYVWNADEDNKVHINDIVLEPTLLRLNSAGSIIQPQVPARPPTPVPSLPEYDNAKTLQTQLLGQIISNSTARGMLYRKAKYDATGAPIDSPYVRNVIYNTARSYWWYEQTQNELIHEIDSGIRWAKANRNAIMADPTLMLGRLPDYNHDAWDVTGFDTTVSPPALTLTSVLTGNNVELEYDPNIVDEPNWNSLNDAEKYFQLYIDGGIINSDTGGRIHNIIHDVTGINVIEWNNYVSNVLGVIRADLNHQENKWGDFEPTKVYVNVVKHINNDTTGAVFIASSGNNTMDLARGNPHPGDEPYMRNAFFHEMGHMLNPNNWNLLDAAELTSDNNSLVQVCGQLHNKGYHTLDVYYGGMAGSYSTAHLQGEFACRTLSLMLSVPGLTFENDIYPQFNAAGLKLRESTVKDIDKQMFNAGLTQRDYSSRPTTSGLLSPVTYRT